MASLPLALEPLTDDTDRLVALAEELADAYSAGCDPPQDPTWQRERLVPPLRQGSAAGRRVTRGGRTVGLLLWDREPGDHLAIGGMILEDAERTEAAYAQLLQLAARLAPLRLIPSPLVGLSQESEARLMDSLGFGRFGRSEMRAPTAAPTTEPALPSGVTLRSARADDEGNLVTTLVAAFGGTFDQYLFQSEPDYAADTARAVREILGGLYGEFLPWASVIAEEAGAPVGALVVVRAPTGPLIVEIAVPPAAQGRGIGRALLVAGLHALRQRGEPSAFLNVTDGNASAERLYTSLGFSRTVTGWSWYSRSHFPVAPDGTPTPRSPATDGPARPGS